jgi:hypothetical protein
MQGDQEAELEDTERSAEASIQVYHGGVWSGRIG